jgi:molecular chaperone GrpE
MSEEKITEADMDNAAGSDEDAGESPFARLESELEKLRNEVLYAQAETQNVRRRLEKEKTDASAYAATNFARDILSVADNLSRALAAMPADLREDERLKALLTGIEMTGKELESVFQRGTVVQEMQAGYMIKDRLLRPALVGVAKAPPPRNDEA